MNTANFTLRSVNFKVQRTSKIMLFSHRIYYSKRVFSMQSLSFRWPLAVFTIADDSNLVTELSRIGVQFLLWWIAYNISPCHARKSLFIYQWQIPSMRCARSRGIVVAVFIITKCTMNTTSRNPCRAVVCHRG